MKLFVNVTIALFAIYGIAGMFLLYGVAMGFIDSNSQDMLSQSLRAVYSLL